MSSTPTPWRCTRTASGRLSQVGYVNKGLARSLAKRVDAGEVVEALFMRGDPPGTCEGSPCVVVVDDEFRKKLVGWPSVPLGSASIG